MSAPTPKMKVRPLIITVVLDFADERIEAKPGRAFVVVELPIEDARMVALYEDTQLGGLPS